MDASGSSNNAVSIGAGKQPKVRGSALTASMQFKSVLTKEEEEFMINLINTVDKGDVIGVEAMLEKRKDEELSRNPSLVANQDKNMNQDYYSFFDRWIFNIDISIIQQTPFYKCRGTTLLHVASIRGDVNVVKLLVEKYHVDPQYSLRDIALTSLSVGKSEINDANNSNNPSRATTPENSNITAPVTNIGKNPLDSALDMIQRMSNVVDFLNQCKLEHLGKGRKSVRKTRTISQTTNVISAFLQFAADGEVDEMKEMLEQGAVDVNCCDYDKRTACHLAASEGQLEALKFLVEEYPKLAKETENLVLECDVVAQDRWGHSPYDDAVRANKTECAEYLRNHGGGEENIFHMTDSSTEEFMILQARGISEKWAIESKDFKMEKDPFASGAGGQLFKVSFRGLPCVAKSCSGMTANKTKLAVDLGNEISMMATLRHPNLVMFLGACFQMSPPILLMEFCEGGTLEEKILKSRTGDGYNLSRKTRLRYIHELSVAMCFLHGCNPPIVHRDLKPSNVLLSGDHIKVTDFGLSKFIPAKNKKLGDKFTMTGETGSYRFMAPEVFKHEEYNGKVDVYSFALIAYWVISGVKPFASISDPVEAVKKAALENHRPSKGPISSFHRATKLLEQAWSQDSSLRPSFAEITDVLGTQEMKSEFKGLWPFW